MGILDKETLNSKDFWIGVLVGLAIIFLVFGEQFIVKVFEGWLFLASCYLLMKGFEGLVKKWIFRRDNGLECD